MVTRDVKPPRRTGRAGYKAGNPGVRSLALSIIRQEPRPCK